MNRDPYIAPEQLSGYGGEEEAGAAEGSCPQPTAGGEADNRGSLAPDTGSGVVVGSGAGAGGGGGPEEYDSDPQAGGGSFSMKHDSPRPDEGADAPVGGSR